MKNLMLLFVFLTARCLLNNAMASPSLFSGGTGIIAGPLKIATLADLKCHSENSCYRASETCFIQTANIDALATSDRNIGNIDKNN